MKKKLCLPDYSKMTLDQIADYWDTHALTDHLDEMEEVKGMTFKRPPDGCMSLRLPRKDLWAIKRIAGRRGLGHTTLVRSWILEKLHPVHG